jgi:hypothetical protein
MRVNHIHRFLFDDGSGTTIDFVPFPNVPGYKYRVILNEKPYAWLEEKRRPTLTEARFFYDSYREARKRENG